MPNLIHILFLITLIIIVISLTIVKLFNGLFDKKEDNQLEKGLDHIDDFYRKRVKRNGEVK